MAKFTEIGVEAVVKGVTEFNRDIGKMETGIGGFANVVTGSLSVAIGNILTGAVNLAVDTLTGLGKAIAGIAKESVLLAADFQDLTVGIGLAAKQDIDAGTTSFEQLKEAAIAVGGDTRLLGVSATGAAEAMTGLFKAGLSTVEIFGDVNTFLDEGAELGGALRAAIDLAAATELDMVQASDLAAIALASFGGELETEEERANFVNTALDNFVKAADASVAEVSDLAAALVTVGPTASAAGFSIEAVNNALAVLSTRGITGASAGTALKSMLTNIQRPTANVVSAMKQYGVELFDAEGNMKSLREIVIEFENAMKGNVTITRFANEITAEQSKELTRLKKKYNTTLTSINDYEAGIKGTNLTDEKRAKKLAELRLQLVNAGAAIADIEEIQGEAITSTRKLTQEEKSLFVQTVAGTFGMNALNTLLGEGVEGWDAMALATDNAAGIQVQAQAKAATFKGQMEGLQGTIETLKIKIGDKLLPVGQKLIGFFSEMITKFGPGIEAVFASIGDALGTFVDLIVDVDFGKIIDDLLGGDFSSLGDLFSGVGEGLDLGFLSGIGDFISNTLPGIIETAVNIFDKLVVFFSETLPGVISFATAAWEQDFLPIINDVVAFVKDTLMPAFNDLVAFFEQEGPGALKSLSVAWDEVWGFIQEVVGKVITWFETNLPLIQETGQVLVDFWKNNIAPTLDNIWNIIRSVFSLFLDNILESVTLIMQIITGDWEGAWETIKRVAVNIWESVKTVFTEFLEGVLNAFGSNIEEFKAQWSTNWELVKTIAAQIWENIVTAITTFVENIKQGVINTVEGIKTFWIEAWESVKETATTIWTNIVTAITTFIENIRQGIVDKIEEIKAFFALSWLLIKSAAAVLWQSIKDAILEKLRSLFESMGINFDEMIARWIAIWEDVLAIGAEIWERIKTAIMIRMIALQFILSEIWNAVSAKITEVWNAIVLKVTEVTASVFEVITLKIQELSDWWTETWDAIGEKLSEVWGRIVTKVTTKAEEVFDAITDKIKELSDWWTTTWGAVSTKLTEIWNGIVSTVTTKAQEIFDVITEKVQGIVDWFSGKIQAFKDAGGGLLQGLIDGIKEKAGSLINAVTGAVEGAINKAKSLLNMESPSKVFMDIGKNTMLGFATGIQDLIPEVQATLQAAISPPSASSPAMAAGSVMGNTINQTNTIQATINNGMDEVMFEQKVLNIVGSAVGI